MSGILVQILDKIDNIETKLDKITKRADELVATIARLSTEKADLKEKVKELSTALSKERIIRRGLEAELAARTAKHVKKGK